MKEFGPRFERLRQAGSVKDLMLDKYREAATSGEPVSIDSKIRSLRRELALRGGALVLAILGAASAGFGFVAEKGQEKTENINGPASVSGEQWEEDVEPFLSYPVPRDSEIKIAQGWIYSGYRNGERHSAVDYIKGENETDADTWSTLPVLAAADGRACLRAFRTFIFGTNYSVRVKHNNDYETRYLHLDKESLDKRRRQIPTCSQPENQWLSIRRGDKIADAGDSGTVRGWIHLHFEVRDENGNPVDPYDIYSQNRRLYPDLLLTNGKDCGPDALFFEEICPRAGVLGIRVTVEPTATPTPANMRQMALALDGMDDGLKIADSESLHLGDAVTIEARIRLTGDFRENDGGDAVLAKGVDREPYALWATFFKCPDYQAAAFFDSGDWVCAGQVIEPGRWVDLAVTYDRQTAIMYVNGREVARESLLGGLTLNNEPLFIGLSPVPGDEDFAGEIDFVALWGKVRTLSQINSDFVGIGSVAQAQGEGLVGFWQFNGDFADSTSNHNDGQPLGDAHLVED